MPLPPFPRHSLSQGAAGDHAEDENRNDNNTLEEVFPGSAEDEGITLSDGDVQILYDILREASRSSTFARQPFHALFPAYRTVLARYDLTSSTDRTYLRFLYRLEQRRDQHQTLFEAFEQRLAQLGIEVELSGELSENAWDNAKPEEKDEAKEGRRTQYADGDAADTRTADMADDLRDLHRPRSRRASFSSFVDFEEHSRSRIRAISTTSVSRLQDHSEGFGARMPPIRSILKSQQTPQEDRGVHVLKHERARQVKKETYPLRAPDVPSESSRFPPTQPKKHAPLSRIPSRRQPFEIYQSSLSSELESDNPTSLESVGSPSNNTQLVRYSDTFYRFRMRDLSRQLLWRWRDVAVQHEWENQVLRLRAEQFDQDRLRRQCFDHLKHAYRLKLHLRRAEEVFAVWEARAKKAHDMFLLTKAFTHWAASTKEERKRSAAARRHMLRVKFFNAWREITALNQLKAQRQVMAKYFAIWKDRFVTTMIHSDKAVAVHDDNLTEKTYWTWFWRFCEERAPQWRNALLKRRYMRRLSEALAAKKDLTDQVEMQRDNAQVYRFFRLWRNRRVQVEIRDETALQFHQRQVVSRALPTWQHQLRLVPAANQTQDMVQSRILSNTFKTWALRSKMQQQARQLDQIRVARNAWTAWNDQLRIEVMRRQISDRLAMQALYKWVLAERAVLFGRVRDERLAHRTFNSITASRANTKIRLEQASAQVALAQGQRLKRSAMVKLVEAYRARQAQAAAASQNYESRVLRSFLEEWHSRYAHTADMSRWATEGVYYLRASRTLRVWRSGLVEGRKRRIQAAYAKVRIQQKKKVANEVLQHFKARLQASQRLSDMCDQAHDESSRALLGKIFGTWRSQFEKVRRQYESATIQRQGLLVSRAMSSWFQQSQSSQQHRAQATLFATSHVEKVAYEGLRKLQLRVIERQNLTAKADSIRVWSSKRHARRLLRAWADRASQGHESSSVPLRDAPDPTRDQAGYRSLPVVSSLQDSDVSTSHVSAQFSWTSYPRELEISSTSPPVYPQSAAPALSGYLSTPSKRAARARALAPDQSTFTPATDLRAMRRAQAMQYSIVPGSEIESGAGGLQTRSTAQRPLVRTLFHTDAGDPRTLQSSRATYVPPGRSRLGSSFIPRSTLFSDEKRVQ